MKTAEKTVKVITAKKRPSEEEQDFIKLRERVIKYFQEKDYNMIVRFGPFNIFDQDENAEVTIVRGETRWDFKGPWDVPQYNASILVVTLEGKEHLSEKEYFTEEEWKELGKVTGAAFIAYPTSGHLSFFREIGW